MPDSALPIEEFLTAACVPLGESHSSGDLEAAEQLLREHPDLATASIQTAAVLGDDLTVRQLLSRQPSSATAPAPPHGWDPLTYLCFSKYLRLDRARSDGFVKAARALLDAGASANTGFYSQEHLPEPALESVLYGAAGIAHHEELTRLLLERGADPNDGEVTYHTPETWDNGALKALVGTGRLTRESLATILLRKTDWHDYEGVKWLLEQGVDPNLMTHWGKTALHNAAVSDNALEIFEVLLDHGGDPTIVGLRPDACRSAAGKTAVALAARRGRGDVLSLFESRGVPIILEGVERLIAACARDDASTVQSIASNQPQVVSELIAEGAQLVLQFAGNGNTEGVRQLLDLGVDVNAVSARGDGYFGTAANSTALHAAAWRARPSTVRFLLARGARIDLPDGRGRTPLNLAVRACVDSYWTERRSPESVRDLLAAGASLDGVPYPSGYAEVDDLLRAHGAQR